jgi:hypothetical protein
MARGENHNDTTKVHPTISVQNMEHLKNLVGKGPYGNNPTAAALYLINRGIDDLIREGVLENYTTKPKNKKKP